MRLLQTWKRIDWREGEWLMCLALEYCHHVRAFHYIAPCVYNPVLSSMSEATRSLIVYAFCSHIKVILLCKLSLMTHVIFAHYFICFALIALFTKLSVISTMPL